MLTILIGFMVSAALMAVFCYLNEERFASSIGFAVILSAVLLGTLCPISGYEDWQPEKRINIITMKKGGNYFVEEEDDMYCYAIKAVLPQKDGELQYNIRKTIPKNKTKLVRNHKYNRPVLRVRIRKAKSTLWTFAFGADQKEYMICLPRVT